MLASGFLGLWRLMVKRSAEVPPASDSAEVIVRPCAAQVHACAAAAARCPDFPQPPPPKIQSCGRICAQTAIIPTNSAIDASAAASSTNIFNIIASLSEEHSMNMFFFCSLVKVEQPVDLKTPFQTNRLVKDSWMSSMIAAAWSGPLGRLGGAMNEP
jgi:hypothetical protein